MAEIISADELTDESIANMDNKTLINSVILSFELEEVERIRIQALMQIRAGELGIAKAVSSMIAAYKKQDKQLENQHKRSVAKRECAIPLKYDEKGVACVTIDNFLLVMQNDPQYDGVHFNLLKNAPEIHNQNGIQAWSDTDEARSKHYMETQYGIYGENKHYDALRILFRERQYHPIQDLVDSLEWDGENRVEHFLSKWMKADDNDYTREVSRLIFAGGIHRLYSPGCKFDDVPVLIGPNQGEGKSTIVRWLAMHDSYFCEVKEVDGQRAIEQLEGAWICEVAELLALTKAKEQEAIKSYITCQRDKYRKPWDKNVSEYPRRCIFIGTTNNTQFLRDKTGNRRWYPIIVKSNGYWLYEHEQECREYIVQCWAEAKVRYGRVDMPNYANKSLMEKYKAAQDDAMEDDWRVGAIEKYLNEQPANALVCIRQIKREALTIGSDYAQDPAPKESQEISVIMGKFKDWEKTGIKYTANYGRQRCWQKTGASADELLPL